MEDRTEKPQVPIGPDPRDQRIAELEKALSEKKANDRFDKLEGSIAQLTTSIASLATAPVKKSDDNSLFLKMLEQSQQHSKDMLTILQNQNKPAAATGEDNLDKLLNRFEKLQLITGTGKSGGGSGRLSDLESRLIDMSVDRLMGGGEETDRETGDPYEDAMKIAIKEFAPIAKTFVEKKLTQEKDANGGAPISQEALQKIYAEAGAAAAKKIQDDLLTQGIHLIAGQDGRLHALPVPKSGGKNVVPPRPTNPGTKVVAQERGAEGVVKKIVVQPTDLSRKAAPPKPPEAPAAPKEEKVQHAQFPMLGDGGSTLKWPFPVRPGEDQYERKPAVDFVLMGIRSEIRQGLPEKAAKNQVVESFVTSDAIEFLDDDLLDRLEVITDGPQLETLLQEAGGDPAQIVEIKKAGEVEAVASYLRRTISTIQREWAVQKAQAKNGPPH